MLCCIVLALDMVAVVYRSMEVFKSEGKQRASEAFYQVFRLFWPPRPANQSSSEDKEDAQEVSIRNLNELRQVRLLTQYHYVND